MPKSLTELRPVWEQYLDLRKSRPSAAHDPAADLRANLKMWVAATEPLSTRDSLKASEQREFDANLLTIKTLKSWVDQIDDDEAPAGPGSKAARSAGDGPSKRGKSFGEKAADAVRAAGGEFGVKALLSGTVDVANPIETDVVRIADVPTTFLDLIVDRRDIAGTNTFSFLRQSVRTNNAAPVADGGTKPTSIYTLGEVEDRVRVIAHLSEAIPERYFADHAELERFLTTEMEAGVIQALEAQVASGDGTGENLTGILSTSGVTAVPYATSTLVTARKAVTALRNANENPTAWVLNPTDDEEFDLLREDGTTGGFLLDQGDDLWKIPRVTSAQVPAAQAILADWRQARLIIREDAQLAADRSGTNFSTNKVTLRLEGRYGFAVLRPAAFAVVDLTAV